MLVCEPAHLRNCVPIVIGIRAEKVDTAAESINHMTVVKMLLSVFMWICGVRDHVGEG